MKTMKRLLALLLALTMVMPNCLTIASAYDEEIVEEVAEELVEESVETPEEEEVFEEVFEEEIEEVFEEEIYEEETEEEPEEVVEEVVAASVTDDVAAVQVEPAQEIQVYIPEVPYDSEALFADHATSVLYPNGPVTMGTNGYDELDTQGQALYEALAAQFKQIADGDLQLTQVTVNLPFVVNIDQLSLVVDALLLDVPHNLYWYDKVSGVLLYTQTGTDGDYQQTIGFAVASAYADTSEITNVKLTVNGVEEERAYYFHTDTTITKTAAETVRKAQAVATSEAFAAYKQKYGSCDTSYDKLKAYVEWICAAVDYDHNAANGNNNYFSATNCNPWQIIYVFDENPNTKVVCEGYSKALQYLCDIATDYEVPQVFAVCGDMYNLSKNPVEGGRHMWNIAVMDGQNYLVDVTNIDGNWDTFLLGGTYEDIVYNYTGGGYAYTAQEYTFSLSGGTVSYEYDQDTMTLYQWDLDEITLAENRYSQPGNTGSDADPATYQVDDASKLLTTLSQAGESGGTVVMNVDAQITKAAGIVGPVTLVVTEGVTLTIAEGVTIHVFGNVKVAGTIVNNGNLVMMGGALDVTGTYSGNGTVDNVHAEDLESVSGVRKSAMNVWANAGTAEELFLSLNYADTYGMVDIRLNGDVTVSGDVTIPENVNLYVNPGITFTVAEGFSAQNNGRIINSGGTIQGTIQGNAPEIAENGGDDGEGEHGGTTDPIEVTDWDSLLAALRQGAGTTVFLKEDLTAPETLAIPAGVKLYVQADLTTNGELALLTGAELNVVDGGSLTTNCAVWVNEGSTLDVAAGCSMTAKDAIHVGFTNENGSPISGELKVNGTLDAYGYVNICKDALLTINGTLTQQPYNENTGLGGMIIDSKGIINVFGTLNQNHEIYNDGQLAVSGTLNNIQGNIRGNVHGIMSVLDGGKLTGFDLHNQIMLYDGAKLTVNEGADLTGMERASVNIRMDDGSSYSGVADEYIYAVWFPDNTEELVANIAESVNGTKYGHSHFIPETSFTLTQNITIHPSSLLQLWNYDATETYTVIVPADVTLTTVADATDPGGIIINAGTQLLVQGTLANGGYVKVTDGQRGHDDVLEPGILQIAQGGKHTGTGNLYEEGGRVIEGSQEAEDSYLSTYWVHNEGEGAFVNHSYPANPEFRMVPGENFQWIFYFNQWNETTQTWKRTPVAPEDLECGPNVKMTLGKDIEWIAQARGDYKDLADYFVGIEVTGGWDTGSYVRYHYSENSYVDYPIHICRDSNRGFYSSADVADNSTWLYEIQDGPAKDNHTFYFHYTGENTISNVKLADEDTFAVMGNVKENVWAITLNEDYVNSLWNHRAQRDDRLKVTYTEANGEDYRTDSVDIGIQSYWADMEAGFTFIDKQDVFEGYNYDAETNSWIDIHENGWSLTELPNGITYDYATNTLTLNNVQLNGMHLHYRDDQGNKLLPNPNLTIALIGESTIGNPGMGSAIVFGSGIKATIVNGEEEGTGKLNLLSENPSNRIRAIDVIPDSQLSLASGEINISNADLFFGGVVNLDGATVNVKTGEVHVDEQLNLNSGVLNTEAVGRQENENHSHYESVFVGPGGTLNVNGGNLNITIPNDATTPSVFFHGINMNNGNLVIDKGTVTINEPENAEGFGIKLGWIYGENNYVEEAPSSFTMNGGKLVMKAKMFLVENGEDSYYTQPDLLWDEGGATVVVNGGTWDLDAVDIELKGNTTWNGGTFNGEEIDFTAGGENFIINGGTFNLSGAEFSEEVYSSSIFRPAGENVQMYGGTINIENGVLGVPGTFALNGGDIKITNNELVDCWGVIIPSWEDGAGCMSVNGGSLTVSVPGGSTPDGSAGSSPAMKVDGSFRQTGGTVDLTSGSTAAIRNSGIVEQSGGTMNLNGSYGIGQLGGGKYEVSGGNLNVEATDTGVFAQNSSVRFVKGYRDGVHVSDPTITILADGAAIQMLSDEDRDDVYESDYAFVDASGNQLVMNKLDGRAIDKYQCYVYTLIKEGTTGESTADYAKFAKIVPAAVEIETQEQWDALTGSPSMGNFGFSRNILIKGDIEICGYNFHLRDNAVMTIAEGASVSITNSSTESGMLFGGSLAAQGNSQIIVQSGGAIHNEGCTLAADMGSITFENGASYTTATEPDGSIQGRLNVHYRNNTLAQVTGVGTEYQTLRASISNMDQYAAVMALAFDKDTGAKVYGNTNITVEGDMVIDRVETLKVPMFLQSDSTLTIAEGAQLIIPAEGHLGATYANLVIHGKVTAEAGSVLNVNYGKVTIGPKGELVNNIDQTQEDDYAYGGLEINGAVINVQGKLTNQGYMALGNGTILTVNGTMENDGFLAMGEYDGDAQLNVNGTLNSYNPILVCSPWDGQYARINVGNGGIVNIHAGDITNNGLMDVSGVLNVLSGGRLNQHNTLLISGSSNLQGVLDNNGRTVLQSADHGGAHMIVTRGGRVDLVDGGIFHIESGATLTNGELDETGEFKENTNGDVRIRMGTLFVFEDGNIEGPWDGDITREGVTAEENRNEASADYLAYVWLNDEDGWHAEPQWGVNRDMRILPGEEYYVQFLYNRWDSNENCWYREPVVPGDSSGIVHMSQLDPENNPGFVKLTTADDNTWNENVTLTYNDLEFYVRIGEDATHGFYNKAGEDRTWLETITVDPMKPEDTVVYFVLTDEAWNMNHEAENFFSLNTDGVEGITGQYAGDDAIAITIPADTISGLTEDFRLEVNYQAVDVNDAENIQHWSYGVDVKRKELGELQSDMWLKIDNRDYDYNAEYQVWFRNGELSSLPENVSYDFVSNTLTLENAALQSLEVGYYGWDGENHCIDESWQSMKQAQITLNLVGENTIHSGQLQDSALRISRGAELNITGSGTLKLSTDHGEEGFHNEDNSERWTCAVIALNNEGSSLTISGNAQVEASVSGKGYYPDNGQWKAASLQVIGGDGSHGSNSITIAGNASLTTVVPEGAVQQNNWIDNTGYTGGFRGIADMGSITIADNAKLITQNLDIGNGTYTQTGGTVQIQALPHQNPHDEDENVNHTHFSGIRTNAGDKGFVTITGGSLDIRIPAPNAGSESAWYFGIEMNGGILEIGGNAKVTIDGAVEGESIKLSHAAMTLKENAVLNFPEEPFTWTTDDGKQAFSRTIAILSDGESNVFMDGGTINATSVVFEFNGSGEEQEDGTWTGGRTVWNGTKLNGTMVYFGAGGSAFTMESGEIKLKGQAYDKDMFFYGVFDAYGSVKINGGTIELTEGCMGVGTDTTLNDGTIRINNTSVYEEGLYVANYFAINGGELNVTVPGGTYAYKEGAVPAALIDGILHQMGGKVNFQVTNATGTESAAIMSNGSVLLNNGEMNLSGHYGIQQFGDGKFEVNGGKLNVQAADTGIYAENSNVCFVPLDEADTEIPDVTIDAGEAAIQVVTDEENNSGITNAYAFYNADNKLLSMKAKKIDHKNEETGEVFTYYAHTLMDGNDYALKAVLGADKMISQADFQQAMEAAIAEGKQSFELTGFVTITENLDLPIAVRVMAGAELTVADSAVLTIQNEKNLTAEYGSITVEAGGRIENNQSQLTNMGGTITINHKEGYAGYVEENGTMMMRSISTPNGLSIGTTTGWPYSKQALGVTCERLDQISWAIGQAKNLGFRNTEIDIWNSVELTYNLTIPENVSVIINSPRADGGSNEVHPVSMLMVPEGKTLTINPATTEGAVNGSLFMNNGSVLQVDSGATVTNKGYLHIGDWQDGTHEFSGIMNVGEGATVSLYGYTAVHHYNAGNEEQPDYIPAVMNVDGIVNTFRVGDDDGGFLDNNGIVNIAGTVNSEFLFNTSGETNIQAGGKLNNNDRMNIYGRVVVQGEVENNAGIFMTADEASFVTEGGKVTNNVCISTEATKATIDFTYGTYVHGSKVFDDVEYTAELDSDYFADGTASNVKVSDMSKVTLRYVVTDMEQIDAFKAAAKSYGNYILAFQEDTVIPEGMKLEVDQGSYLAVKPGKTLTNNGSILNKGTMYLGDKSNGANLVNNGTLENNPGAMMAVNGSYSGNGEVYVGMKGDGSLSVPTGIDKGKITILSGINGQVDPLTHLKNAAAQDITGYAGMEIHLFENVTVENELKLTGGSKKVLFVHDGATLTIAKNAELQGGAVEVLEGGQVQVNGTYIVPNTQVKAGAAFNIGTAGLLLNNSDGFTTEAGSLLTNYGTIDNNSSFGPAAMTVSGVYKPGKNAVVLTQELIGGMKQGCQTLVRNITTASEISELAEDAVGCAGSIANFSGSAMNITENLTIPAGMELKIGADENGAELTVDAGIQLTVNGKLTICQSAGENSLINNGTVEITANGVLANYDTIYNNSGAALIVNGTMDPYGTVINNNGAMSGDGSFGGTCGTGLTWKLSGSTLTISGEGAMASAPWNDLAFIGNVETVKLTSKLTSIVEDAFAQCKSGVSIVIPRAVTSIGDNAFASDANVKIYHGSQAENLIPAENRKYIHEIDPDTGKCTECDYDVTNLLEAVQKEKDTQGKVEVITSVDTTDLKEQIQKELNSGATSNAVEAVKEAEQYLANDNNLSFDVQNDSSVIGAISDDAIVGALLSASEDTEQVTLVVTDAEDIPVVEPGLAEQYSSNGAVPFEMTLEGVDDPENLAAPVTVTLPIPEELLDKQIVVIHHGFNGTEVIHPLIDRLAGTATFAVDGFSTFAYHPVAVAYVGESTNTYGELQTAIEEAKNGSTVTLLADYEGMGIIVNKAISIDPNGCALSYDDIFVAKGFKKTVENGVYRISAIKQLNPEEIQLKTGLTYNGQEQTVLKQITDGETVLEEGVDYTVTGGKATNAGSYTVTITGAGEYSGELSFSWSIAKAKISVKLPTLEKTYGEADPDFRADIQQTGWIEDKATVQYEIHAEDENVGTHNVGATVTILDEHNNDRSGNYDITVNPGKLTVHKAMVSIQVNHEIHVTTPATENNPVSIPRIACQISVEGGNYTDDRLSKLFAEIHPTWSGDTTVLGAVHDVNPDSYVKSDNYNVELSGTVTIILGDYVCWNPATGEYWNDLSDALEAVDDAAEETIEMLSDAREKFIVVAPGTTLNLNGFVVNATLVTSFKDAHVVDPKRTGMLVVPNADDVILSASNSEMALWKDTGYVFGTMRPKVDGGARGLRLYPEQDLLEYRFNLTYSGALKPLLLDDGLENNKAYVEIYLTWDKCSEDGTITEGTAFQNYVYSNDFVKAVASSTSGLYLFTLNRYTELENLTLTVYVVSETGVRSSVQTHNIT